MDQVTTAELLLVGIVFFAYTTQTISGFGNTIIAVTLGAHLFPLSVLLPLYMILDVLLNGFLSLRYARQVRMKFLFVHLLPATVVGVSVGLLVFDSLDGEILKTVLGVFVMLLSATELVTIARKRSRPLHKLWQKVFFLLGGVIHGMYASGGPLVVYAASREPMEKTEFRAVLTTLWTLVAALMLTFYFFNGQLTLEVGKLSLLLLPAILAGLVLGELLHHRIKETHFRVFIYVLLFFAGAALV